MKPGLTDVVYVVDSTPLYKEMAFVSAYSLAMVCRHPLNVHLFYMPGSDVPDRDRKVLDAVSEANRSVRVTVRTVPRKYSVVLAGLARCTPLGPACCARFLIPLMLDKVGQCLYVDSDTAFVKDPVDELDGFCRDWAVPASTAGVRDCLPLMRPADPVCTMPGYVNGGVLLMDLDVWRASSACQRLVFDVMTEGRRFNDQDSVNLLERPVPLPPTMNFVSGWLFYGFPVEMYNMVCGTSYADYQEALGKAAVLHFTGDSKPLLPESRLNAAVAPMVDMYLERYGAYLAAIGYDNRLREGLESRVKAPAGAGKEIEDAKQ